MSITVNRNTTQTPLPVSGITGTQSLKFIQAPRVYIKHPDSLTNTPTYTVISDGITPLGWTDLGVIEGQVKIGVEKKVTRVTTGIDNYFRGAYASEKVGTIEFDLTQFDDVLMGLITGITASVVSSGSIVSFNIGTEELNVVAILLICQNKLDGKEIQFYNPAASLNFSFEDAEDALLLRAKGLLPFFVPVGATAESMLTTTVFRNGYTLFDSHPGLFDGASPLFDNQ